MDAKFKEILANSRLCKYSSSADLDMLLTNSKIIEYDPGMVVLAQGAISPGTHIIIDGEAEVTAKVLGVGIITMTVLDQGNFIGEISQLLQTPSTVSVIAKTALRCFYIAKSYFDMLGTLYPEVRYHISKAVIEDVCLRQQNLHKKITTYIMQAQMLEKTACATATPALTDAQEVILAEVDLSLERLAKMELLDRLSRDELATLLANCTILDTPRHTTIMQEGDSTPSCYLILRGAVQITLRRAHKIAKLCVLAPVKIFCCHSFLDGSPSIFDYTTCEHSILLKLTAANLADLKAQNKILWYRLYEEIGKSFAALEQAASKLEIRLNSELYNR